MAGAGAVVGTSPPAFACYHGWHDVPWRAEHGLGVVALPDALGECVEEQASLKRSWGAVAVTLVNRDSGA